MLILLSILVTNIVVNRRHAYEGGWLITFGEWTTQLGGSLARGRSLSWCPA